MRILLTNIWLLSRSGTEVVIRDFALALARRGHQPIVYAPQSGEPATELRARGISVVDSLEHIKEAPDIIHGQHNVPTVEALATFPQVPAVWICHDFDSWHDEPPHFPQIRRYIAVDFACRD